MPTIPPPQKVKSISAAAVASASAKQLLKAKAVLALEKKLEAKSKADEAVVDAVAKRAEFNADVAVYAARFSAEKKRFEMAVANASASELAAKKAQLANLEAAHREMKTKQMVENIKLKVLEASAANLEKLSKVAETSHSATSAAADPKPKNKNGKSRKNDVAGEVPGGPLVPAVPA